jgi:hypothetical protein
MRIFRILKQNCSKVRNPNEIESHRDDVVVNFALVKMHFHIPFLTS